MYTATCCVQARVMAGTKPELVVLMDIPNVKAHRARLLYAAGLKTAEAVAGSSEATLMSILAKGNLMSLLIQASIMSHLTKLISCSS